MADDQIWDSGLFDDEGNPIPPDIIYPPSLLEPCSKYVRPSPIAEDEGFGIASLLHSIFASSIAGDDRFGLITLIISIMSISLAPDDEFGLHSLTPGSVTIYPPSLIEAECA